LADSQISIERYGGTKQNGTCLDEFSPLSDFENAIQDSLSEVSKIFHVPGVKTTSKEKIRLYKVRSQYNAGLVDQQQLESLWKQWKDEPEFLIIQNQDTGENLAMKCSKRGNDVYQYRIKERFREIDYLASDLDYDNFSPNDTDKKTNALFVTLTYDTKRCTQSESWNNIGKEYNRWISNLKRKFGKFSGIRCFESFVNGYPHIHALIFFEDRKFDVFEHCPTNDIMQGSTYRIQEKKQFQSWHSNVDVLAVNNMSQALHYITKYLKKSNNEDSPKYATTQSLLWVHNKRSFSISGKFKKQLEAYRLERQLHNSNKIIRQLDISGNVIHEKWNFVGIYSLSEIQSCNKIVNTKAWHFKIDTIPEKDKQGAAQNDDKINKSLSAVNRGLPVF
jgi:hypothetical protein